MVTKLCGACVCGKSLGLHTRRAARRHRAQWEDALGVAALVGAFGWLVDMLANPERTQRQLAELSEGFTAGIRALSEP